jgi:hypothetical protein
LRKNNGHRFFESGGFPSARRPESATVFKTDFKIWLRFGWISDLKPEEISLDEKIQYLLAL